MAIRIDKKDFREKLVQAVKDAGQDLIDRAEDLAGTSDMLYSMSITIDFDPEFNMLTPTISLERNYICKQAIERTSYRLNSKSDDSKA